MPGKAARRKGLKKRPAGQTVAQGAKRTSGRACQWSQIVEKTRQTVCQTASCGGVGRVQTRALGRPGDGQPLRFTGWPGRQRDKGYLQLALYRRALLAVVNGAKTNKISIVKNIYEIFWQFVHVKYVLLAIINITKIDYF
jgi:hypothetical protein